MFMTYYHGCFPLFYKLRTHPVMNKTVQIMANLWSRMNFLSKENWKLNYLFLSIPSDCCQKKYAQIIGLNKGLFFPLPYTKRKLFSFLKLHLLRIQYVKHSSICAGSTRSQPFTWKMILHRYSQKKILWKYSLPFMVQWYTEMFVLHLLWAQGRSLSTDNRPVCLVLYLER